MSKTVVAADTVLIIAKQSWFFCLFIVVTVTVLIRNEGVIVLSSSFDLLKLKNYTVCQMKGLKTSFENFL